MWRTWTENGRHNTRRENCSVTNFIIRAIHQLLITLIKSRRIINVYKVFVGNPAGKRSFVDRRINCRTTYGPSNVG